MSITAKRNKPGIENTISKEEAIQNKNSLYFHIIISDWQKTNQLQKLYVHNPLNRREKSIGEEQTVLSTVIPDMAIPKDTVKSISKLGLIKLPEEAITLFYELFIDNDPNDLYISKIEAFLKEFVLPLVPEKARKRKGGLLQQEEVKAGKFTVSGHYIDQKLKHSYERETKQLSLFDALLPQTKEKITEEEVIVEGIKLTEKEEQVLNGILRLLYEKSDTKKDNGNKPSNKQTYFKGNLPAERVNYGGIITETPKLRFKPSELYETVLSNKAPSGFEIAIIRKALRSLQNRKYLIAYNRKYTVGKKIKIDRIEEYQPLLKILHYYKGLSQEELNKIEAGDQTIKKAKGEIILLLNPLFIDQVDTKFIEYPVDINRLTKIARGGGRVHTAITNLRDYLLRAISSQKKKNIIEHTIDKDKLHYQLGLEKFVKQSRKKLLQTRVEESIEVCKNLNLITEAEEQTGVKGQAQIVFTLNLNY